MATKWIKSMHCKSKALDDVVQHRCPSTKAVPHSLSSSASCKNSVQNLRDIVEITRQSKSKMLKQKKRQPQTPPQSRRTIVRNPEPVSQARSHGTESSFFPSLTELPEGHASRNVVEIIFHTSWGAKQFSGRVEMVFKIQNLTRTISRFEEYREVVKRRASCSEVEDDGGEDHARSIADGNEVMRFYCLGSTPTGGTCVGGSDIWAFHGSKEAAAAVCTFSGSGVAHERAGAGRGRRAMLVCRVIAGRIRKQLDYGSLIDGGARYDSVSGENGELLVFDSRALLPCFLIIYKL
ncbi:hypothetical protein F511_17404 [Dorcoceras hygrometricum]|uniref:Uncharacterized protein n=1 Tax=Dorcoceras hygrometricum TaxID=472368 RepID=A0A2Z7C266_9LAMI|nr:hypothetical protein F511_17404 [Dorcoceras hygrometricum]